MSVSFSTGAGVSSGQPKLARSAHDGAPPRVLHIIAPGAFGGLEQVVLQLAAGRAQRVLPTEAVALVSEGAATPTIVDALRAGGVRTTMVTSPHRAYRNEQRQIATAISAFRADIVHTHGYRTDVLAARPARDAAVGLISTAHGFTGGNVKNRLFEWLERRAWRRFDVVVAVSRPLRDRIVHSGVPDDVVRLCPNAWSGREPLSREAARQRLGLTDHDRVIAWIGRLSAEKGADVMVRVAAHLPPDVRVMMVGDGRLRESLLRLAAELGVTDRICWAGMVADAGQQMAAFDAFALSSRTEGTPMVLFEAMAARVPIVATRVGGVPDVVSPAEAVLVPADDPAALGTAISACLRDTAAAHARADAARRKLDSTYALAPWLDRYEELYAQVALRQAARAG